MIPTLPFGRTGHDSTRVVFGAAALAEVTQDEADRTLALLVAHGVHHIDGSARSSSATATGSSSPPRPVSAPRRARTRRSTSRSSGCAPTTST